MRSNKLGAAALALVAMVTLSGCGGPDAEQVNRKDPAAVYAAFEQALTQSAYDVTAGTGPNAVPYTVELARSLNERLDIKVLIAGQQAGVANFTFAPHNAGAETIVTGDIDVDLDLIGKTFGSTPDNRVAGVPPLAWNAGIRKMLRNAAERVENGAPLDSGPQLLAKSLDSGV